MSAAEAAVLLKGGPDGKPVAAVTELSRTSAVISTGVYPVRSSSHISECWSGGSHNGVDYQFCSSSWENFHNVHSLARTELERELGRSLTDADVDPDWLAGSHASFHSQWIVGYFVAETLFLTAVLIGISAGLGRIRNPLLIPPLFTSAALVAFVFLLWYAPALSDADTFYQRIALEEVIGGRGPLGGAFIVIWLVMTPLSLICLPAYGLLRAFRHFVAPSRDSLRTLRR